MNLKQNISEQTNESEQLSPVLEKLRRETQGFKVPDGYFDSLSPRIVDRITNENDRSFIKTIVPYLRKPLVWAPAMASVVVVLLLVFAVPSKKASTIQVIDEWTELNMAYDASYAEEALLAESTIIETELANSKINNRELISLTQKEPTIDEITEYLKEHETNTDILNEY